MITQTIDLCMIPGSTNPVIHVNQYDAYPGGLIFNLYEESAFEIPAGAAVTINGTKPDKYGFSYTASYSGNVVTADLEQQMTAVAGNVECELRVSLGSEIIGTQNFTLCVEDAALNNETIISDSDMPAIANAQRYAEEAAASAEEAAQILSSKVDKSGDTMTGTLDIKSDDITLGSVPSSNVFSQIRTNVVDSNGTVLGYICPLYRTTDVSGYNISAVRNVNGVDKYNSINLQLDSSGNPSVKVTSAAAWREALETPPISALSAWETATITAGTNVTDNNSIVYYNESLKLCICTFCLALVNTSYSSGASLISGLPKPAGNIFGTLGFGVSPSTSVIRVRISTTGNLVMHGGMTPLAQIYNAQFVYPYTSLS